MSLSRRSLLTRLAALLASVPLLRLRGEAKATGTTADGPQTAYLRAALKHPTTAWVPRRHGMSKSRAYHWSDCPTNAGGSACSCVVKVRVFHADTPPRDGGWM